MRVQSKDRLEESNSNATSGAQTMASVTGD